MRVFKSLILSVLLITTPALFAHPLPAPVISTAHTTQEQAASIPLQLHGLSYDQILTLLAQIESGELEERCTPEDVERLSMFVSDLAVQGLLPNDVEASLALGNDIQDLLFPESSYAYALFSDDLVVAPLFHGERDMFLCKSWLHKKWDQIKDFAKKHKKALIIGAAVVVAAAVVVGVAVAASAAAATAAGAASAGDSPQTKSNEPSTASADAPATILDPLVKSALEEQVVSFKETITNEQFFQSSLPNTLEDSGRVAGSLFGHDSLRQLPSTFSEYPGLSLALQNAHDKNISSVHNYSLTLAHQAVDRQFSTDYAALYTKTDHHPDLNILSYQLRGERALASGQLHQAVYDFGKTIELNPTSPIPYLERGVAHFGLGEYDRSIADYNQFLSQAKQTYPLSIPEFSLGFAKGLPKGIYESGHGLFILLSDVIMHPIQTGGQMWEALTLLSDLARSGAWSTLSEVLAPEIHQLVTQWDTIPSDKRGEMAGYAFGKYGADILIPGALVKATARGLKGAQEISAVYRGLQTAEKTLLLESAAGLGNGAKIGEVVQANQRAFTLGEELGYTTQEIGKLKQTGKLQETLTHTYEEISRNPAWRESYELFHRAQELLKPYTKKPLPELQVRELIHQFGIRTFPRPEGIPDNFLVMVSNTGAGMVYVHPTNAHIRVRVMPGKPHSPNPSQQKPYVVQQKSGQAFDKHGNLIQLEKPEAHIPLEEFVYRE